MSPETSEAVERHRATLETIAQLDVDLEIVEDAQNILESADGSNRGEMP